MIHQRIMDEKKKITINYNINIIDLSIKKRSLQFDRQTIRQRYVNNRSIHKKNGINYHSTISDIMRHFPNAGEDPIVIREIASGEGNLVNLIEMS